MKRLMLLIAAIGLAAVSCGYEPQMKNSDYSHSETLSLERASDSVGLLSYNGEPLCTAFVSSEAEITTAYHCVEKGPGQLHDVALLDFTLSTGEILKLKDIKELIAKKDTATISLNEPTEKYLKILSDQQLNESTSLSMLPFDVDNNEVSILRSCKLEKHYEIAGAFAHNCKSVGHFSGAPLFYRGNVIGMHVGFKKKVDRGVAIDFSNKKDTEILELEFERQGCHHRIRKGNWHTRNCKVVEDIKEPAKKISSAIIRAYEEEAKRSKKEAEDAAKLVEKIENQTNLLKDISIVWKEFDVCFEDSKRKQDRPLLESCRTDFQRKLGVIIKKVSAELKNEADVEKEKHLDRLKSIERATEISERIVKDHSLFNDCLDNALVQESPGRETTKCYTVFREQMRIHAVSIATYLDDNPWGE